MNIDNPTISVVMSVYNGEKYIAETLDSILGQSFIEFELIVINDCSTDNSLSILESYAASDARIRIINNAVNKKLPASLNVGIRAARGKYIARMDADDISLSHRFQTQFDFMESNPELSFVGTLVKCFYDDDNVGSAYATTSAMEEIHFNFIDPSHDTERTTQLITAETYKTTRICHSSLFGRTDAFKKIMYREDVFAEDWDLYNRAINRGLLISKVPEVLVKYRIVNTGMCGQFNEQSKSDIRQKISKLNNGILKDCFSSGSYKNGLKFFWYHYCRFYLATFVLFLRRVFGIVVMRPLFKVMKAIYHALPPSALKFLFRVLSKINRYRIFHKIPVFNRILSISMAVLTANKDVNFAAFEDFSVKKRINIGIWTIEKKWAMGGLNTILKMIPTIISRNEKVRVINYGLHSEELIQEFLGFVDENFKVEGKIVSEHVEVISASTYRNNQIRFNKSDQFIAGFWEPAEDFIKFRKLQHFENDNFVYIIQDYEPSMLYRWGSEYIRSKATLEDKGYYPIYNNSVFVCGYMKSLGIIDGWNDEQVLHGEPCDTKPLPASNMNTSDIKLVFYSRPTVDKNVYALKVEALKLFIDHITDNKPQMLNGLEITGIGEKADDIEYRGVTIKNHGKVDYRDYVNFLKQFNVGMSCIISPAFAYPCLEFPRAGIVTVVNRFENRDLSSYSSNIVSCDNNVQSMFESLVIASEKIANTEERYEQSSFVLPGVNIEKATEVMLKAMQV
ncbi:glycosyltransferase family 2 protein [Grimontia marina]|uniref:Putative glycosyltransferase EpsE n=1 Tax=Grimontia marina TaxID=646534 RepID=A0A128ET04_9GAMM|nr:glycosyltransferase family 2 protein [Grimontia marina]CZF77330.1 Putative glycosyltransferase EpsE [Grimontia marina]